MIAAEIQAWNTFYTHEGTINSQPSSEITSLIPRMKEEGVITVLDVGCGTGRHTNHLTNNGFDTYGVDISQTALSQARVEQNGNYVLASQATLPFQDEIFDWIIASHAIEYGADSRQIVSELDRVLKPGGRISLRVLSSHHPFSSALPSDISGFSHSGTMIKRGLPVHFFTEDELKSLYSTYDIDRLEHRSPPLDNPRFTVPLHEWILLAYKPSNKNVQII